MNKELKPCPFCGGEAKVSDVFGRAGVICKDCLAEMRGYLDMTEEEVIEAWNRRATVEWNYCPNCGAKMLKGTEE